MPFTKIISPVAIDLGAMNTGVYCAQYHEGEVIGPQHGSFATVVMPKEPSKFQNSQSDRQSNRASRRSASRLKKAKRLMKLIISGPLGVVIESGELEALNGLMNRRGYNRIETEIDLSPLDDISPLYMADVFPEIFDSFTPLKTQLLNLLNDIDRTRLLLESDNIGLDAKKLIAQFFSNVDEDEKKLKACFKSIKDAAVELINGIDKGHRHRSEYIDLIEAEIQKDSRLHRIAEIIGAEQLKNIIGNISNLQDKMLRKYFNNPKMKGGDFYDEKSLRKYFNNWLISWRPEQEEEKERKSYLTQAIRETTDIIEFFKTTDPKLTIPPYEDNNNRNPPKDQTLWLNPDAMTARYGNKWSIWVNNLKKHNQNLTESITSILKQIDRDSRRPKHKDHVIDDAPYEDSYFLQRLLDRSSNLDPYSLRLLAKESKSNRAQEAHRTLSLHLKEQHMEGFISFCTQYYKEVARAKNGIWVENDSNLLEIANINPPSKRKVVNILVGNILCHEMSMEEYEGFVKNIWSASIGRSTLKGICRSIEATRKKHGNSFNELINSAKYKIAKGQNPSKHFKGDLKVVWDDYQKVEPAASFIAEKLSLSESQKRRFNNSFSLSQLYNIIECGQSGFSKITMAASLETNWRMKAIATDSGEYANCSRLPADSVRPFDGFLGRMLGAKAYEIAKLKVEQIKQIGHTGVSISLPIIIEQNKFSMGDELLKIKGKKAKKNKGKEVDPEVKWQDKKDRIRDAGFNLCPYTGQLLGRGAEYDHIIPRSQSRKNASTIYNSEANLIYASRKGNKDKDCTRYYLRDLSEKYLKKVYGTSDVKSITEIIKTTVSGLGRSFSFSSLEPNEQRDVRHALFLDPSSDTYKRVFNSISTHNATKVNGTQGWLVKLIIKNIESLLSEWLHETGNDVVFDSCKIDAEEVSLIRSSLSEENVALIKKMKKPTTSGENKNQKDVQENVQEDNAKPTEDKDSEVSQGVTSHSLDAYCAFVAAASGVLARSLKQAEDLSEDKGTVLGGIPNNSQIVHIKKKPKYRKDSPFSNQIFKRSNYSESFLTTWISASKVLSGFSLYNSDEEGQSGFLEWKNGTARRPQDVDIEGFLNLIAPFCKQSINIESVLQSDALVQLNIDKLSAQDHLQKVATEPCSDFELMQAELLECLRYTTKKENIKDILTTKDKFKSKSDILKDANFQVNRTSGHKVQSIGRFSGKLIHPVKSQWEKLCEIPEFGDQNAKKLNWSLVGSRYFGSGSSRSHSKTREIFSLPKIDNPSGGYRVKQKNQDGTHVYQIVCIEESGFTGFSQNENKIEMKNFAPLEVLNNKSIVETGSRYSQPSDGVVYFDEWIDVNVDSEKVIECQISPATKERRYVRIKQKFDHFKEWTNNPELSIFNISSSVSINDETRESFVSFHDNKIFGRPRKNIFIEEVGDVIVFKYEVGSSPKEMNDALIESYFKSSKE